MNPKFGKLAIFFASVALVLVAWSPSSLGAGPMFQETKTLYNQKCASCHGTDGSGKTAMGTKLNLKDLRSKEVQGMTDAKLLEVTSKGKGKMPGYEKSLGADKCKQLVGYVRELAKK